MGSFACRSEPTVSLEMVQAEVKFGAGGGELAGTMQTTAPVVMWADLCRNVEERGPHQ